MTPPPDLTDAEIAELQRTVRVAATIAPDIQIRIDHLRSLLDEVERWRRGMSEAGVRVFVEPCEAGGHYVNPETRATFHPSPCARAALKGEG